MLFDRGFVILERANVAAGMGMLVERVSDVRFSGYSFSCALHPQAVACPTLKQEVSYRRSIVTISAEGSYERVLPATVTSTLQCSGHGVCLTLREAGRGFDGL